MRPEPLPKPSASRIRLHPRAAHSRLLGVLLSTGLLGGCDTLSYHLHQAQVQAQSRASVAPPSGVSGRNPATAASVIRATGYAPISLQPGATAEQKMLMAMRASRLRAYQELAAQVHGQYLFGTSRVRDLVLQDEQFSAAVAGVIRGARVVQTYPVQEDTYATILELDLSDVQQAYIVRP